MTQRVSGCASLLTLITLFLTSFSSLLAQGRSPDLWWTSSNVMRELHYHSQWGIIANSVRGLFRGPNVDSLQQMLSAEDFVRIRAMNRVAILKNGSWIISGGTASLETNGTTYLYRPSATVPETLNYDRLDSQSVGGGLFDLNTYVALEPSNFVIVDTYSTDSGNSWYRAPTPDSLSVSNGLTTWLEHLNYVGDVGFVAFSYVDTSWRYLNVASKTWQPTQRIPRNVRETVFLQNGAAVGAISGGNEVYTGIAIQESPESPWKSIERVAVENEGGAGAVIKIPMLSFSQVLIQCNDSLVVMPLDSGVVLVSNGRFVRAYRMGMAPQLARNINKVGYHAVYGDEVYLSYGNIDGNARRTMAFNIKELRSRTVYDGKIGKMFVLGSSIYFGHESSMLMMIDEQQGLLRPCGKARFEDGSLVSPVVFSSLVVSDDTVHCTDNSGAVLSIDSRNHKVHYRSWARYESMRYIEKREQHEIGMATMVATAMSLMSRGGNGVYAEQGRERRRLRTDSISAVSWHTPEELYSGFRELFVSSNSGTSWRTVATPFQAEKFKPAIGSIQATDDALWIGFKGYVSHSEDTLDYKVPGGLYRSLDRGLTWMNIELPTRDTWVESIHATEGGDLYCMSSMYVWDRWSEEGTMRYQDWHLSRSTDDGASWAVVQTWTRADQKAAHGTWNISSSSSTIAVNTNREVQISHDDGKSWSEVQEFPYETFVTGCAVTQSGDVWVSTEIGIYIHSKPTSVSASEQHGISRNGMIVFPNPNFGVFDVAFTSEIPAGTDINFVTITDSFGRRLDAFSDRIIIQPRDSKNIRVLVNDLARGVYVLSVSINGESHTATFCVLN